MSHLNEKQINDLLKGSVSGFEMKNALLHFESCTICQAKMPNLEKADLLGIVLREPILPDNSPKYTEKKSFFLSFAPFAWKFGFAGIILLIFGGIIFWILFKNNSSQQLVQNSPEKVQPTPFISSETNKNSAENSVNNNQNTQLQNVNVNSKISNNTNAKPANVEAKPIQKQTETEPNEVNLELLEKQEFAKNLNKVPKSLSGLESAEPEVRSTNEKTTKIVAKYPVSEVIKENQPILSWNSVGNAESYIVTVYDESYEVVYSKEVTQTSLKIDTPLKRGEKYQWQVKAKLKDDENSKLTSLPTFFRVAKNEKIEKINKNDSLWKKANIYFQAGLLSDAEKTANEILKQNPKDKLAIKFLQKIKSLKKQAQKPPIETKPAQ